MIVTPEEAKDKWCPNSRVLGPGGSSAVNRTGSSNQNCIGCRCMAWQWIPRYHFGEGRQMEPTHGFCGAFQRPPDSEIEQSDEDRKLWDKSFCR